MAGVPKLKANDWATIVTSVERGEKNIRELADQFGVSRQAIHEGLKKRGISKGSRLQEVMTETDDLARKDRERRVKQAGVMTDQYAKWNDALAKLTMKKIIDGGLAPGGIAAFNADILTIKNAIAVVRTAREENWDILGLVDLLGENAELPDLNVGEYTPEEIEKIRALNEAGYLEGLDDEDENFNFDDYDPSAEVDEGDEDIEASED